MPQKRQSCWQRPRLRTGRARCFWRCPSRCPDAGCCNPAHTQPDRQPACPAALPGSGWAFSSWFRRCSGVLRVQRSAGQGRPSWAQPFPLQSGCRSWPAVLPSDRPGQSGHRPPSCIHTTSSSISSFSIVCNCARARRSQLSTVFVGTAIIRPISAAVYPS